VLPQVENYPGTERVPVGRVGAGSKSGTAKPFSQFSSGEKTSFKKSLIIICK
jgi:hypothetical protein